MNIGLWKRERILHSINENIQPTATPYNTQNAHCSLTGTDAMC